MQTDPRTLAAATPAQPLAADELVSDDTLRLLAKGEPGWQRGEISDEVQAILAMSLPDICGELLAWRKAGRLDPAVPNPKPRNHGEEIAALLRLRASTAG